jgi:hypothetical protein
MGIMHREYCIGLLLRGLMGIGRKWKEMEDLRLFIIVQVLNRGKELPKEIWS